MPSTAHNGPSVWSASARSSWNPPGRRYDAAFKEQVLSAYQDRMSLRGIQRTFGVCYQTRDGLAGGKKTGQLPAFKDTLLPSEKGDVLELDELWSFVQAKAQTLWRWVALCRRTRQIVAWSLGDRSEQGAADLRASLPPGYRVVPRAAISGGLTKRFPGQNASLLRQGGRRDLPRRALVWHPAPARQPPGSQSLVLLQVPGEPPGGHPLLHHHLQPRHPTTSNKELNTTRKVDSATRLGAGGLTITLHAMYAQTRKPR